MGIYSSNNIFGIQIYNFNDDISNVLYEEKFDEIMSYQQMREAYLFYNNLNNKENLYFKMYTECIITLDNNNCMMWHPLSLNTFLEKFNI